MVARQRKPAQVTMVFQVLYSVFMLLSDGQKELAFE